MGHKSQNHEAEAQTLIEKQNSLHWPTVASETLEGMFLVNNSSDIWRRAPKHSAMDFL